MVLITDNNRDAIIQSYAESILSGMDFLTLYEFAFDRIVESKDLMDNSVLEDEIREFYPEVLDFE